MATEPTRAPLRMAGWILRIVAAGSLAVDAFVHADLVARYASNRSGGLSQGELFQIEAGAAALGALLVLLSGRRIVWAFVFAVAASALAAILISANYDIGRVGPIPDMYEPLWYPEKKLTAVFEAVATGTAVLGFVVETVVLQARRRRRESPPPARHRLALSALRQPRG